MDDFEIHMNVCENLLNTSMNVGFKAQTKGVEGHMGNNEVVVRRGKNEGNEQ